MDNEKLTSLHHFSADHKITSWWREKKKVLGHLIARASKMPLKLAL